MAHAERCPICLGKGKVACTGKKAVIPWIEQPNCHGCGGKGWIEVADELQQGYWPWPICDCGTKTFMADQLLSGTNTS